MTRVFEWIGIKFNPIFIRRVGKKIGNKPRTLKVTFTNELAALSVLKNKKNLANTNFTQVSIQNDLTPRQMEYLNNLRQELKTRIESGENGITIKYKNGIPTIVTSPAKN